MGDARTADPSRHMSIFKIDEDANSRILYVRLLSALLERPAFIIELYFVYGLGSPFGSVFGLRFGANPKLHAYSKPNPEDFASSVSLVLHSRYSLVSIRLESLNDTRMIQIADSIKTVVPKCTLPTCQLRQPHARSEIAPLVGSGATCHARPECRFFLRRRSSSLASPPAAPPPCAALPPP